MEKRNNDWLIIAGFASMMIILLIHIISVLESMNEMGDAFNGLIGPFISLVASILVYKSFKAQTDANTITKDQFDIANNQFKNQDKERKTEILTENILRFINEMDTYIDPANIVCIASLHKNYSDFNTRHVSKIDMTFVENIENVQLVLESDYRIIDNYLRLANYIILKINLLQTIDAEKGLEIGDYFAFKFGNPLLSFITNRPMDILDELDILIEEKINSLLTNSNSNNIDIYCTLAKNKAYGLKIFLNSNYSLMKTLQKNFENMNHNMRI